MKLVKLGRPSIIDGAVRYPAENPLLVTNAMADRLKAIGDLDGDPEEPQAEPKAAKRSSKPEKEA